MVGLTNPQLQISMDHRSLGCLFVELDLPTLKADPILPETPVLRLQIHFGPRWQELWEGRVQLGWRRGTLKLHTDGGWIPQSDRLLPTELDLITLEEHHDPRLTLEHRARIHCRPLAQPQFTEALLWEFEAGQDQVLSGVLPWTNLARITRTGSHLRIQVEFLAKEEDLWILDSEGIWPAAISPNKLIVMRRLLARHLFRAQGHPFLSYLELHYG